MNNHFVITSRDSEDDGTRAALGTRDEVFKQLSHYNTQPEIEGGDSLWGPGIRLDVSPGEDPIRQMLLYIVEEEIAWLAVVRLAKRFNWMIIDIESGRELQP